MKRARIRDVAEAAGVSVATVSYVLNHVENQTISAETEARVMEAVRELKYVANRAAASLKNGRSALFGLFVPCTDQGEADLSDGLLAAAAASAQKTAEGLGYQVLLQRADTEGACLAVARNRGLDGAIILGRDGAPLASEMAEAGVKTVLAFAASDDRRVSSLCWDEAGGARLAVGHLAACGHRKIAFLGPETEGMFLAGCREGLKEAGLAFSRRRVLTAGGWEEAEAAGREIAAMGDVSAVLAASDELAACALRGLVSAGLRVPSDISLVGFGDTPLARVLTPSLTSVRLDAAGMGRMAAARLVDMVEGGEEAEHEVLGVDLINRESVDRPSGREGGFRP